MQFLKRLFGLGATPSIDGESSNPSSLALGSASDAIPNDQLEPNEALIDAVLALDITEAVRLLAKGADPNARVGHQQVPLITAITVQHGDTQEVADLVRLLAENGADVDAPWTDSIEKQTTALMIAAESDYGILTKTLLNCGVDPNVRDGTGRTALERCGGQAPYQLLVAATQVEPMTLFEAIAHSKVYSDSDDDRLALQYGEPITVEKSCLTCGFFDRSDHSCGEHHSELSPQRLYFPPERASLMYCDNWEDEALVNLLIRGFSIPAISYHRRHPTLIESNRKRSAWQSFANRQANPDGA